MIISEDSILINERCIYFLNMLKYKLKTIRAFLFLIIIIFLLKYFINNKIPKISIKLN